MKSKAQSRSWRFSIAIRGLMLVLVLSLVVACGSTSAPPRTTATPTPTPTSSIHQVFGTVGTSGVTVGGWTIDLQTASETRSNDSMQAFLGPDQTYLDLFVSLQADASVQLPTTVNFRLHDSAGHEYTGPPDFIGIQQPLVGQLESASDGGDLLYIVPVSVKTFTLTYSPNVYPPVEAVWEIDL